MGEKLGQHFLRSKKVLSDIIDATDISARDTILEIGPGRGILTEQLLPFAARVIAIEKDKELSQFLREKFKAEIENGRLNLLEQDVRNFDPCSINALKASEAITYKLVSNIPYYITGEILRQFLSSSCKPSQMVLLVQKEVAQRIVAKDGKESILSLSVKAYGTSKIIAKVPKKAFSPPPKVDSAILLIEDISREFFEGINEDLFFKIIKRGFAHKRKTLVNNLKNEVTIDTLEQFLKENNYSLKIRAEKLSLSDWKKLILLL